MVIVMAGRGSDRLAVKRDGVFAEEGVKDIFREPAEIRPAVFLAVARIYQLTSDVQFAAYIHVRFVIGVYHKTQGPLIGYRLITGL
jgi:hypothetical protein